MKTVSVATLKQKLSEYLRFIEQGDEVVVTSHRRPVARLVPDNGMGVVIRPPTLPITALKRVKGVTPLKGYSVDADLAWDRARR